MNVSINKRLRQFAGQRTRGRQHAAPPGLAGAVLMEVILAVTLFVGAAVVIGTALHASGQALDRLRLNTHAANLATSLLAEMQIGVHPWQAGGPAPFAEPFQAWTWEIVLSSADDSFTEVSQLQRVEIIVRHTESRMTHRICQLLPVRPAPAEESAASAPRFRPQLAQALSFGAASRTTAGAKVGGWQ